MPNEGQSKSAGSNINLISCWFVSLIMLMLTALVAGLSYQIFLWSAGL